MPGYIYMITAGTYHKKPIFNSPIKLALLQDIIRDRCRISGWDLQAWVVLKNHYHILVRAPRDGMDLPGLIRTIHSRSARLINKVEKCAGRRVWYNYWDTCIRSEGEYLSRVRYILLNPIRHGIVEDIEDYGFSSYWLFPERNEFILTLPQTFMHLEIDDDY